MVLTSCVMKRKHLSSSSLSPRGCRPNVESFQGFSGTLSPSSKSTMPLRRTRSRNGEDQKLCQPNQRTKWLALGQPGSLEHQVGGHSTLIPRSPVYVYIHISLEAAYLICILGNYACQDFQPLSQTPGPSSNPSDHLSHAGLLKVASHD